MRVVFISLIAFFSTSCATLVKKPEVENVKKVGIISLYANEKVPSENFKGQITGWNAPFRAKIGNNALKVYEKKLKDLGWDVVDVSMARASTEYDQAFGVQKVENTAVNTVMNFLADKMSESYFTPAGMQPILFDQGDASSNMTLNGKPVGTRTVLSEMATKHNVDAMVIVQIDYCYGSGTWSLGGTGQGKVFAQTSIRAVDRKGSMVVDMKDLIPCDKKHRGVSEGSLLMNNHNIVFLGSDEGKMEKMFVDATMASADVTIKRLKEAMQ